ncbi:MAG: hypothetical protein JWM58_2216 [Rhizobium sp.]|nr:hypothetical protein [Rhizobium sp.]
MMQNISAKKDGQPDDAAARASDSEINERLVDILKANAIKAERPAAAAEGKTGFFAEAYALISLVGLMIVAYFYSLLVNKEA